MSFIKQLISLLFTYPKQALGSISIENIKTLVFALKHEPPKRIFHNIVKRFKSTTTEEQIVITTDDQTFQSKISLVKKSLIAERYILIEGSITPSECISKFEISHDIIGSHPIEIKSGNFNKLIEVEKEHDSNNLKLCLEYSNGSVGSFLLNLERNSDYHSLNINLQYQIYRKQKAELSFHPSLKKISAQNIPKFSIVIPTYNGNVNQFYECIDSIAAQTYNNLELCIYDDASTDQQFQQALDELPNKYKKLAIKIKVGNENKGIALATNNAIALATGDYVSFMDQDDFLDLEAFSNIASSILDNKSTPKLIYTDEDHIDQKGSHCDPIYKPDYSPTTLKSSNYINHLTTILKSEGDKIGWLRSQFDGAQDYDLVLRITEACKPDEIVHIPEILYHWRKSDQSIANRPEAKKYVYQAAKHALEDYLQRNDLQASVENGHRIGTYKIKYNLCKEPLVSIIIPFKDQKEVLETCITSLLNNTSYKNYEVLLMSNNSQEDDTITYCKELSVSNDNVKFIEHNFPFNYSQINNVAVKNSKGEYLLFLNNDTESINSNWLTEMVAIIQQEPVGAVGAKLLYPNKTIQHAGIILGMNGNAGYINKSVQDEVYDGYYMGITKNVIACTGACLMTSRSLFDKLNGFDEELFKVNFNDVDYCLKVYDAGKEIVYCPDAMLYHHESYTRGNNLTKERKSKDRIEIKNLKSKWKHLFEQGDPFFNPNLSLYHEQLSLNLY